MKRFYGRKKELAVLQKMERRDCATFVVLTGRRRVGKTELLKEFMKGIESSCYLFVNKTAEPILCSQWQESLGNMGLRIPGRVNTLRDLIREVFIYSEDHHFSLIIDEFQDLQYVCPSFFSALQEMWDTWQGRTRINLVVSGSSYSMMTKIFEDAKEPLFGRVTAKIILKPLPPSVLKEILSDYAPNWSKEDLLALFSLTGGVPRYVSLLMDSGAYSKEEMLSEVLSIYSPFLSDGKDILISEIGKEYSIFFSILRLIAQGYTTQSEIDSVIGKNTGSYLEKLENVFCVIKKNKPLFAPEGARKAHWRIDDQYLRFYFSFIYPNQSLVELGDEKHLRAAVEKGYDTFSGKTLEDYFFKCLEEEGGYTLLGAWWDRKGENEMDLIAIDSTEKRCVFHEIKKNKDKYSEAVLREKAEFFMKNIPGYCVEYKGLSMEDM